MKCDKPYDESKEEYELYDAVLEARNNSGLTLDEIAQRMGTKKSAVSRLLSCLLNQKHSPSISSLRKFADATGYELEINLVPKDKQKIQHDSLAKLEEFMNTYDANKTIHDGVPGEIFTALRNVMNLSYKTLSEVFSIPGETIHRRKSEGHFNAHESEKIMKLVRLFLLAKDVLGDPEDAAKWFREESLPLGSTTPLECAKTYLGRQKVKELLYRIEYTIYS